VRLDAARTLHARSLKPGVSAGLKAHDGKVFKPFQSGRRGEREHEFYERVLRSRDSQSDSGSSMLPSLIPLIPRYFGIVKAPAEAEGSSPPNSKATRRK
jgi:hypothetical protein